MKQKVPATLTDQKIVSCTMTSEQQALWNALDHFDLDDAQSALTFSERLSRENGWSLLFTLRCIEEYKRFIFLACVAGHPVTPSDEVDQVWHLHLLYTESYWIEMCQHILKKNIHHGPTKGGKQEDEKFTDWYARTKESYTRLFNQPPPIDIWPSSEVRFKPANFQRINLDGKWIIKKLF